MLAFSDENLARLMIAASAIAQAPGAAKSTPDQPAVTGDSNQIKPKP